MKDVDGDVNGGGELISKYIHARTVIWPLCFSAKWTADHASKDGTFATSSIDHVYCSNPEIILNYGKHDNSCTDHNPIFAVVKVGKIKSAVKAAFIEKRSFKSFSDLKFRGDVCGQPWEMLGMETDVDRMVEHYERFVNNALDKQTPIKRIRIRQNYQPGLSKETKAMMAKTSVTAIFPVTLAPPGIKPNILLNQMKKNTVNNYGINRR